jgi:hypothetical protein
MGVMSWTLNWEKKGRGVSCTSAVKTDKGTGGWRAQI